MFLSIVQAGIDRNVGSNVVDIDGRFKINRVSNDIFKIQKVDGSILYDALELSFNSIAKTSILNNNNIDIVASINTKAVSSDVYIKADIGLIFSSLIGAAPAVLNTIVEIATALGHDSKYATTIQHQIDNKADKLDTYSEAEINVASGSLQAGVNNKVLINAVDVNGKFNINGVSNDILKIQRVDGTTLYDSFEISFNPVYKTSRLNKKNNNNVNIVQAINTNDVAANVYIKSEIYIALNLKSNTLTT